MLVPQLLHVADNMDHNPQPVVEQENRGSQFDNGLAYEDQPLSHCDRLEAELFAAGLRRVILISSAPHYLGTFRNRLLLYLHDPVFNPRLRIRWRLEEPLSKAVL